MSLTTPRTMKLKGMIKDTEVTVLIDCGATYNFIGTNLVRDLQLPLVSTTSYRVVMGTEIAVKGKGIYRGVVLPMQRLIVVQDFSPLDLGNTDVVLWMQWLGSLGSMKVNWKQLSIKFKLGNSHMVLQRGPGLNKSRVSLKTMMKEIKQEGLGVLEEFGSLTVTVSPVSSPTPKEIQVVLA